MNALTLIIRTPHRPRCAACGQILNQNAAEAIVFRRNVNDDTAWISLVCWQCGNHPDPLFLADALKTTVADSEARDWHYGAGILLYAPAFDPTGSTRTRLLRTPRAPNGDPHPITRDDDETAS